MRQVLLRNIDELHPYKQNARKHSSNQIGKVAESISRFGFNNPILVDKENTIVAGHGRWEAAKKLKIAQVAAPKIRPKDWRQFQPETCRN